MIFGDASRFAVEFILNDIYHGAWLNGKACYWIGGRPVGDFPYSTTLRDLLWEWDAMLEARGQRNGGSWDLPTPELVSRMRRHYQGVSEEPERNGEWPHPTDVCPSIDIFFDWQVRLFENGERSRCVFYHGPSDTFGECLLDEGEFDRVLHLAVIALSNRLKQEMTADERVWMTKLEERASKFEASASLAIEARIPFIASRQDLASFVRALLEDLKKNPDDWENLTIERYLESMAAWIIDADAYFRDQSSPKPTWETVGAILIAPKFYE